MSINYQRKLDKLIENNQQNNVIPTLLIHACCAPCSSYVLEYLSQYFNIKILFYNPNINPESEYRYRLNEEQRLISEMSFKNKVELIKGDYVPEDFFSAVKGFEYEPEGGKRCEVCFRLRLEETARYCKEFNADYFATTLTISPLKNAEKINRIGEEVAEKYGVKYLPSDFKKKNGYKRSIELSKEYDLYRQNFCGCVFSKAESNGK
jgi:hypothetical protein